MSKTLFIEGTSDRSNGNLRQGFNKLLQKVLNKRMPRIIMGNSKEQTINKFQKNKLDGDEYLLIDLDEEASKKEDQLEKLSLKTRENDIFFMIQEMEAWFLSQPQILDDYYGTNISSKIANINPKKIKDPVKLLEQHTHKTKKGKYHKVKHGTGLLELLNPNQLSNDFEEFERMLNALT